MACENLSLGRLKPCKDSVGGIQVNIPPPVALDAARVIAFPIATYVPFTLPPGLSHEDRVASAFVRVLGGIP